MNNTTSLNEVTADLQAKLLDYADENFIDCTQQEASFLAAAIVQEASEHFFDVVVTDARFNEMLDAARGIK